MTEQINGAEAMVKMLEAHGVQHIFGLCGDTTLPFYDAMLRLDHNIKHVLTRDERCATYMADAYSRVTGRVGVCEGPSGGGATYILPGLIEASESSYAVLGITTDISVASYGKYPLTEVDQDALMKPLTKWNTVIKQAIHIPRMVRTAFRAMTTGRSGAAHLGLPYDIQYDKVETSDIWADKKLQTYPAYPQAPEPGAAEEALEAILSAKRPLIVCGGGVVIAGAMEELDRLATRLNIPVATSISGQGSLADTHPNSLGVVGSNGGTDETWEQMKAADMVIFMGCRAGSTTTSRWEAPSVKTRVLFFDNDPMVIGCNYQAEVGVVGDLRLSLAAVNAALDKKAEVNSDFGGAQLVREAKRRKFEIFNKLAQSTERPIRPERVIDAMMKTLPEDAVVVSDPGTSCPYFNAYYQQPLPGRYYITNRAHGALGYSLSAALGAWYGRPGSKVVAMMGDGSFGFTCGELETVCRAGANITFIVFSNSNFGWIKASQYADKDARYYNVDFNRTDHAAIASAFGVKSWRVENPQDLERVLKEAIEHDGPTLIDVITQPLEESNAPVRRWMG
ncbi:MAG: thiamine pyrophosphate-binding protein [Cohaesibacter sp.]|nr:thiamine pyrophosphate-binding protein [Cohaesibacter sp.]MCV6602995.1 thiamine pyrophosphate-binding protein [Cohaesibacter sp.]